MGKKKRLTRAEWTAFNKSASERLLKENREQWDEAIRMKQEDYRLDRPDKLIEMERGKNDNDAAEK